jgi:hypothetical protein
LDPDAAIADHDLDSFIPDPETEDQRTWLTTVGVKHYVVARFADGRLEVVEQLCVECEPLTSACQSGSHEREALGPAV